MMTNEKQEIIRNSVSYKLVHAIALWMDRRLLDPLIGLVLPGFGDALTSVLADKGICGGRQSHHAGDRPESGRYGFSHRDSLRTYLCHGIGCCKNCGMGWFLFLTKRI